jgi:hypothetical protein
MLMFNVATMPRQHRRLFGERVIICDDRSGVTHGAEVLARIEKVPTWRPL